MDLSELKLFNALHNRASSCKTSLALSGSIVSISKNVSPLLEYIKQSFPAYPDHGIEHAGRVLIRIGQILTQEAIDQLNSMELFLLIYSALLHDIGMVAPDTLIPNDPKVRSTHHLRSAAIAEDYLQKNVALDFTKRISGVAGYVIKSHGVEWDEMAKDPHFYRNETVGVFSVRPSILATLLRIGDLLDLDSDRTSTLCLSFYRDWVERNQSIPHHERHTLVSHFDCTPEKIEIEVECKTKEHHRIWAQWLNYLRTDIERANTYLLRGELRDFQLPIPNTSIKPTPEAKFKLWNLHFQIDESGQLWEILRQSIYTGKYDFLRELVSNGIDACLKLIFDTPQAAIDGLMPRCWKSGDYSPLVLIAYDRQANMLVVYDNGIGMNADELQSFLFKVASRGRAKLEVQRGIKLQTIGHFGVGFISILTRASQVKLITRKSGESGMGVLVEMDSNLRDASVEPVDCKYTGTTVVLNLKNVDEKRNENMSDYVSSRFSCTSVPLYFIDIDSIRQMSKIASDAKLELPDLPLQKWMSGLIDRIVDCHDLVETVEEFMVRANKLYKEESSRLARVGKRKLKSENASTDKVGGEKPNLKQQNSAEVVRGFGYYLDKCRVFRSSDPPPRPGFNVATILNLSHKALPENTVPLTVDNIKRGIQFGDMSILVIPVMIDDSQRGIEWRSLHSFLVSERKVSRYIGFDFRLFSESLDEMITHYPYDDPESNALYERIEAELEDSPDDFLISEILREKRLSRQIKDVKDPELEYTEITVKDKDIIIQTVEADGDKYPEESVFSTIHVGTKSRAKSRVDYAKEIALWYQAGYQSVAQDGILLPIKIIDIAPVGATVGLLNLTGSSRFRLNVNRNEIDQSPESLSMWRSEVGNYILNIIAKKIKRYFSTCELDCEWTRLWMNTDGKSGVMNAYDWNAISDNLEKQ